MSKMYSKRDILKQGVFYTRHISAMKKDGLHGKSDIASELAHRDIKIEQLQARADEYEDELLLFRSVASLICLQESDEWSSNEVQTNKDYAEVCGQRIDKLSPENVKAWLLRQKAAAIDDIAENMVKDMTLIEVRTLASLLRQAANEADQAGGNAIKCL
jgi:hypothetical protein